MELMRIQHPFKKEKIVAIPKKMGSELNKQENYDYVFLYSFVTLVSLFPKENASILYLGSIPLQ